MSSPLELSPIYPMEQERHVSSPLEDDQDVDTSEGGKADEHQGGAKKKMEPGMMCSHHHHISISRWWHRIEKSK